MGIIKWLFETRSDLDILLDILNKYNLVSTNNALASQTFYVGKHRSLKFSVDDEACALYYNGDIVPLFMFNEKEELESIRQFVVGKCASTAVSLNSAHYARQAYSPEIEQ